MKSSLSIANKYKQMKEKWNWNVPVRHIEHAIGRIVVETFAIVANFVVASNIVVRVSFGRTYSC